ncbi:MAG TPA: 50S ribosomal protein L13 [Candidatus Bathyarchaeia archaeon]|nr:50S ribosomal protein L13 [Candidatus Bathyarchaeia archaeon]
MPNELIIDAKNQILGRLASYAAKQAIDGNMVIVLNAEKAVISGKRTNIVEEAKRRLETRTLGHQENAPVHQRRPDLYLRRVVRGMLPWSKPKGRAAYHRVHVYVGVPEEFTGKKATIVPGADASKLLSPYVTLEDLATEIGG